MRWSLTPPAVGSKCLPCGTCRTPGAAPVRQRRVFGLQQLLTALLVFTLLSFALDLRAFDALRMEQAALRQGSAATLGLKALQAVLSRAADQTDEARLDTVNQFFNRRIQFRSDQEVWGQADYWASPIELLEKGQGDCEDYVIAKYFSLLALGMPTAKLRLVYVRAQLGGEGGVVQAHMVLAYYPTPPTLPTPPTPPVPNAPQAEPLILDNLVSDIRPASRRPDLTPVFSFNSDGLWQGVNGAPDGDPLVRLSRWREVVGKAKVEGFL
jgi:predicted transglutaminase-like cysteine proteinase